MTQNAFANQIPGHFKLDFLKNYERCQVAFFACSYIFPETTNIFGFGMTLSLRGFSANQIAEYSRLKYLKNYRGIKLLFRMYLDTY